MLKCWFLLQKEKGVGDTQFRVYSCRYFGCNLFASHDSQEEGTVEMKEEVTANRITLSQKIGLLKSGIFNTGVSFLMRLHP